MITQTNRERFLEMRARPGLCWAPVTAGMYGEAVRLAYLGRIHEALERAVEIRIQEYGDAHGVLFRVVESTKAIHVLNPDALNEG